MSKVSFVIPCYKSEATISSVVDDIETLMKSRENEYEIVLVNDGSPDNTFGVIRALCKKNERIKGVNFAKNFGQHSAIMAGLRLCTGDYVVCLDDDGQTPALEAYKLIDALKDYDVAYARYEHKKHSFYRNAGSYINSKMAELMLGKPKHLYISSFFAAKKFVIDEVIKYVNPYPYIYGLVLRTTNSITNVPVNHKEREVGNSGYTLKKLLGLWFNGFTSFSVIPLRISTYLGLITTFIGVILVVLVVINKMVNGAAPLGWSSMMIAMLFLGGIILTTLGLLGEYIGRIYICLNDSPQYVTSEVIDSRK